LIKTFPDLDEATAPELLLPANVYAESDSDDDSLPEFSSTDAVNGQSPALTL
jgi:hypothetical protein